MRVLFGNPTSVVRESLESVMRRLAGGHDDQRDFPYIHRFVHCDVEDVHCFVDQALRMWDGRKIPRNSVERSWRGDTDGEYCSLVQIIDNKLQVLNSLERNLSSYEPGWRRDL